MTKSIKFFALTYGIESSYEKLLTRNGTWVFFSKVENEFSSKLFLYLGSKLTQSYHCRFEASAKI